jgi:hypothetical protein
MARVIALFVLLLVFAVPINAQTKCPSILIEGPKTLVPDGQTERYRVIVTPVESGWSLRYRWSVSQGELVSGQNSPTIEVLRTERYRGLTVTAEISGLPGERNCPTKVSEASAYLPKPQAVNIGDWKNGQEQTLLERFAEEPVSNSDNQGYAFIISGPSSTPQSLAELRKAIADNSAPPAGQWSRLTIVEADGPEEMAELWRVPPGAHNPKCESCTTIGCPDFKVIVPDKPTPPGEIVEVSLSIDPAPTQPITVYWEVSAGTIESGQGTKAIALRTSRESAGHSVTFTAKLNGLPKGCGSISTGELSVRPVPNGHAFDEYGRLPLGDELGHIDAVIPILSQHSGRTAYFILYRGPNESMRSVRVRGRRIIDHLVKTRKLSRNRFILLSGGKFVERWTRVEIRAPGAEKPPYEPLNARP